MTWFRIFQTSCQCLQIVQMICTVQTCLVRNLSTRLLRARCCCCRVAHSLVKRPLNSYRHPIMVCSSNSLANCWEYLLVGGGELLKHDDKPSRRMSMSSGAVWRVSQSLRIAWRDLRRHSERSGWGALKDVVAVFSVAVAAGAFRESFWDIMVGDMVCG